ncbi:ABC transporter substrate-binding protein [Curvivirga aplysinae]|uniref:ABC transporter substrate-binding protein n=1 Tax=Curvivirga aplysinae TaxID=2529852 RepID=UPI0012BCFD8E|nr:ABC transporter substrate-binding protein [Curvivirga aplysinae]MTI10686.1 sugar ABC transporter substrate-binding protein [Curvivirga aplysinae]
MMLIIKNQLDNWHKRTWTKLDTQKVSIFVFTLSLISILSYSPLLAAERKDILFVNPGYEDKGFWKSVSQTMEAASDALGFNLEIVSANRGWPVMLSKGIAAIDRSKPDYLIIVNEQQQASKLLQYAIDHKIPTLMLLNSLTQEQEEHFGKPREKSPYWLGSIVPDNETAGYQMLTSLFEHHNQISPPITGEREKIIPLLTLAGDINTPASIDRLNGLDRGLKEHPSFKELRRITVNWSGEEAYLRTQQLLLTKSVNAIWAANDAIAIGAIRALREIGMEPGQDACVVGLNWSTEAIDLVERGEMTLTHGGHFLAGAWSIVMLYDYDQGHDFSKISTHIKFPMTAINRENVKAYKKVFGKQDWTKINFKSFTLHDNPERTEYPFTLDYLLNTVPH